LLTEGAAADQGFSMFTFKQLRTMLVEQLEALLPHTTGSVRSDRFSCIMLYWRPQFSEEKMSA
jgi:hypothetical protein